MYALAMPFIQRQVQVIKAMRMDLMKLGFGQEEDARPVHIYIHAAFTFRVPVTHKSTRAVC